MACSIVLQDVISVLLLVLLAALCSVAAPATELLVPQEAMEEVASSATLRGAEDPGYGMESSAAMERVEHPEQYEDPTNEENPTTGPESTSGEVPTAQQERESLRVQMHSAISARYVAAAKGGWIHAHSNRGGKAAKFYETSPAPGLIRLESVKYPGRYMVIKNRKLVIDVPSDDNDIFEVEFHQDAHTNGYFALRLAKSKNCYVAFDAEGKRLNACGLSTENPGVWLTKIIL